MAIELPIGLKINQNEDEIFILKFDVLFSTFLEIVYNMFIISKEGTC